MSPSKAGRRNRSDSTMLAGWLFADLLLALFVVVLAATPGDPAAAKSTRSTTTSSSSTTTTTTLAETPKGINTVPVSFEVNVDRGRLVAGDAGERARVAGVMQAELAARGLTGHRAGLVLSFGGTDAGIATAAAFNEALAAGLPVEFGAGDPRGVIYRNYKDTRDQQVRSRPTSSSTRSVVVGPASTLRSVGVSLRRMTIEQITHM